MASYFTRQQKAVADCIAAHAGETLSAADVCALLSAQGLHIGQATVYRQLDRLSREGHMHKLVTEDGAYYRCCAHGGEGGCFLLKCERCGRIEHVDCSQLSPLYDHLTNEHGFVINPNKTMLYGSCRRCREAQE